MESPCYDANFGINQAAKDLAFTQFRDFPAEVQVLVFEQAVLATAEELPDLYKFEFICNGSNMTVALVSPSPQLTRACETVRSLMQTCRAALEAVISVTGGKLRVGHKKMDEGRQLIRYEYLPFDFERSTFCVDLVYKTLPFGPDDSSGKRALVVRPALPSLHFTPRVKNLSLIVGSASVLGPKYREKVSNLIKFFPQLTNCTLICERYWRKTTVLGQSGDDYEQQYRAKDAFARNSWWGLTFYKDISCYHRSLDIVRELTDSFVELHSMYDSTTSAKNPAFSVSSQLDDGLDELDKLSGKSYDEPEQMTQKPTTLDDVGVVGHALDWVGAKLFGDDGSWLCWVSVKIHLQRTAKKDGSSALDGASWDALWIEPAKIPDRGVLKQWRRTGARKLSREEEALIEAVAPDRSPIDW